MTRIGKYEIIELLGQGAMGKVYKARHTMIDEVVALKVLSPVEELMADLDDLRNRFVREAKILWRLKHPHIVAVTDVGEVDGNPYYAMEYLPRSLADEMGAGEGTRRRKGHLPEKQVVSIARQALEALNFLHGKKIVHRDVKPDNILLTENGKVKLCDFGIAKVLTGTSYTKSGIGMGTGGFMAPEQEEARTVDHRADLYSLSIALYVMLTGRHPYQTRFKDPGHLNPGISPNWDSLVEKGTQPEPEERFQDAQEMLETLDRVKENKTEVRAPDPPPAKVPVQALTKKEPRYRLRSDSKTVPEDGFKKVFGLNNKRRLLEYILNDYEDNGDVTVTDHATGLMWQQSGSDTYLNYSKVEAYISVLNRKQFAGYGDWRLPTIPELISLLTKEKQSNDLYIDSIFDNKQKWCWSTDQRSSGSAWGVHFSLGEVGWDDFLYNYVRAVRSRQ